MVEKYPVVLPTDAIEKDPNDIPDVVEKYPVEVPDVEEISEVVIIYSSCEDNSFGKTDT